MRGLRVSGRVVKKAEPREIPTRYGTAIIADAELEDPSGRIQWRLWRDQVNSVSIGDMVVVENAFVRSVGGSLELNLGADGKIAISREQMPRTATEVR
jgi:ssDNA-binding replication factor A large subunit